MAEAGRRHDLVQEGKARRVLGAVGHQQAVVQPDLHRDIAVDEAAQLFPRLVPAAFGILLPASVEAEGAAGVFPDLVECALAAVERRRAPLRPPAEREAVARGAVGEQDVALAIEAVHPEQSGEIAASGIGVLRIAPGAEPRHGMIGVLVALDIRHWGLLYPVRSAD